MIHFPLVSVICTDPSYCDPCYRAGRKAWRRQHRTWNGGRK
jgi:hypothetical protein